MQVLDREPVQGRQPLQLGHEAGHVLVEGGRPQEDRMDQMRNQHHLLPQRIGVNINPLFIP